MPAELGNACTSGDGSSDANGILLQKFVSNDTTRAIICDGQFANRQGWCTDRAHRSWLLQLICNA